MKTTFSIIKADVGGWPGHAWVHPDLKEVANIKLRDAQVSGLVKIFMSQTVAMIWNLL